MSERLPSEGGARRRDDRPGFPIIPEVNIVAEIGRGGMGTVYRGEQPFIQREVAVKVLKSDLGGSDSSRRFRREARLLARMSHPAIVACLAAGTTEAGLSYIVMELIDGPDLHHWLRDNGELETREALQLTLSLARALAYAYDLGIIHRDIKTANVLLSPRPGAGDDDLFPFEAKLADLGLARPQDLDGQSSMAVTLAGVALGTPSCMAPEQFDTPEQVDFRADIYGLGCVLFHCLTGRAAFPQQGLSEVMTTKMHPIAPNPRALSPELSHPVSHLVSRMIATERDERHRDYAALIAELEELLEQSAAAPARSLWPKVLGVALLIMALIGGVLWQTGESEPGRANAEPRRTADTAGTHEDAPATPSLSAPAARWPLEQRGRSAATELGYPAGSTVELTVRSPATLDGPPTHVVWTLFETPEQARSLLEQQLAGFGNGPVGQLLLPRVAGLDSYQIKINVQPRREEAPRGFESFSLAVDSTRDERSIREPRQLMDERQLLGWTLRPGSPRHFKEAPDSPGLQGYSRGSKEGATAASIALPAGDWQLSGAFRALFTGQDWYTEVGLWVGCSPGPTRMLVIKALEPAEDSRDTVAAVYELSTVEFAPGATPLYGGEPHTGTPNRGLFHVPWGRNDGDASSREVEFTLRKQGTDLSLTVRGQESARFVTQLQVQPGELGIFVFGGVGDFRDFRLLPPD